MHPLISIIAASRRRTGSDAYRAAVLADSPVAYWRLGETSGTAAVDEMGTYPGTYVGSPTLGASGIFTGNTALTVNGTTQWVTTDLTPPTGSAARTIEMWAKPSVIDATERRAFGYGNSTITGLFCALSIETVASVRHALFRHAGGNRRFAWPSAAGSWVHVALVVPSGAATTDDVLLYLNGVSVAGTRNAGSNQTLATSAITIAIGAGNDNGTVSFPFSGTIDEIAIYPAALSPTRIAAHYAAAGY